MVRQIPLHLVPRNLRGRRCCRLPIEVLGAEGGGQQRHAHEQNVQVTKRKNEKTKKRKNEKTTKQQNNKTTKWETLI